MKNNWIKNTDFEDIKYEHGHGNTQGIAKITINRPEVRNAFRPLTVKEMRLALDDARDDTKIGVIIRSHIGGWLWLIIFKNKIEFCQNSVSIPINNCLNTNPVVIAPIAKKAEGNNIEKGDSLIEPRLFFLLL